jgi:glycosyltransferase involved in cell wall biosynthesis
VRVRWPWTALRSRRALARSLALSRPDVVVCHSAWAHALFAGVVERAGIPVAFFLHDLVEGRHWLERLAARHVPDVVLANSALTAGTARALFPGAPVEVVTLPVPAPPAGGASRDETRRALGVEPGVPVVVVASRLAPWKGHALLLEALARLPAGRPWACWVVGGPRGPGEGAWLETLRSRAAALGPRVRFLGERQDVSALLGAADVHCQPNLSPEPFGLAFAEAMAAGLPVVTTHPGAASGVVDGTCARVVDASADAVAAALGDLLWDTAWQRRLGEAGRTRARALFDVHEQVAALERVLSGVVQRRRNSSTAL